MDTVCAFLHHQERKSYKNMHQHIIKQDCCCKGYRLFEHLSSQTLHQKQAIILSSQSYLKKHRKFSHVADSESNIQRPRYVVFV